MTVNYYVALRFTDSEFTGFSDSIKMAAIICVNRGCFDTQGVACAYLMEDANFWMFHQIFNRNFGNNSQKLHSLIKIHKTR